MYLVDEDGDEADEFFEAITTRGRCILKNITHKYTVIDHDEPDINRDATTEILTELGTGNMHVCYYVLTNVVDCA